MANYPFIRQVSAGTTFLSPTDFLVQVFTNNGSVQLVLPKISTILASGTTVYQFSGIRFSDVSKNASANNITITANSDDFINGQSSLVLSSDGAGGIFTLIGFNEWSYTSLADGLPEDYLFQQTPIETGYPSFTQGNDVLGYVNDNGLTYNPPYVKLSNGNVAQLGLVQTILGGSIYIFQAWDYETVDPNPFYWVAMRQSATNSKKLEYICDLQWTNQYFNQFYTYIKNTSTSSDLSCVYINYISPITDSDPIEVYQTTLTFSNNTLVATDTLLDFGGETFLSLYNALTGLGVGSLSLDYADPLFSANSDFTQLLNPDGVFSGYVYYWDTNEANLYTNIIGYNIVTGQTRLVNPYNKLSTTSNFTPIDIYQSIVFVLSHPKGIFFLLDDQQTTSNGQSLLGVTSIWSPDIANNSIVKYINNRNEVGQYSSVNGGLNNNNLTGIAFLNAPFDNDYVYCYDSPVITGNCTNLIVYRFKLNYSDESSYDVVSLPFNNETQANPIAAVASFSTDNGMLMASLSIPAVQQYSFNFHWVYWNNLKENPSQLQLNEYAPTNYYGNTIYCTTVNYSAVNWNSYGVTYDKYNQKF